MIKLKKIIMPYYIFIMKIKSFFGKYISNWLNGMLYYHHYVFWPKNKLHLSSSASINNCLLNTNSGHIYIWDFVFCGHNTSIITGTHDYNKFNEERLMYFPKEWNDIIIEKGVRIWSSVTILWPCKIWEWAVIAAWSIVINDVKPYTIVWWIPAKFIKSIKH